MNPNGFIKKVLRYFLQGLFYIAPIGITLYVIYLIFLFIDKLLWNLIEKYLGMQSPGLGVVIIFAIITFIGILGSTIILKPFIYFIDKTIIKAPVIKILYSSIKDLMSAFVGDNKKFTEPVLVKVGREPGLEKIGFITRRDLSVIGIGPEKVAVYLPHSYNFSGNLFIVPVENITPLKVAPTEALKFIISAGVTEINK